MSDIWIYVLACLAIIVVPGPALLFILARTLSGGFKAGIFSAIGVSLGLFVSSLASIFGLALLLDQHPSLVGVIKYFGAAYLLYLSYMNMRSEYTFEVERQAKQNQYFIQAFTVSLFNPKTMIFFAAFLPGFITADQHYLFQITMLAVIFISIALIFDIIVVFGSQAIARRTLHNIKENNTTLKLFSSVSLFVIAIFLVS